MKKILKARTEKRTYSVAFCPKCNKEHNVYTGGKGKEVCRCGTTFYWATRRINIDEWIEDNFALTSLIFALAAITTGWLVF